MADKADDAFRTIGEMAGEIGVKPHILRYWEEQFPMLRPLKRAGGRRHYRPEDAALLRHIRVLLQDRGFTVKGARRFLENGSGEAVKEAARQDSAQTAKSPAQAGRAFDVLRSVRDRLAAALEGA